MAFSPQFLSLGRVIELQRDSVATYGGDPSVRDIGLLESAIAQPRATYGGKFLHEDLPTMAATYLYHLVMNDPFVDGNKRVGAMSAFVFLDMNDADYNAPESEYRDLVLNLAPGRRDKADVIAFFKEHVH